MSKDKLQIYNEFIDLFQEMLDTAVEFENYEDAAELRDTINELKVDKILLATEIDCLENELKS
jgi:protein-arginine kinase activator protein McsA